ncbi:hypothetical protein [Flavobacterium hydrophilum]|uniref:Uncharacterized protein n=1 Tax=Flavobacterium hydrophilum TaxID=2211445 RepID=A0A2V4C176_9FLAO|nr:hypothetical protein [Flavobacterium hydrophilum]PXY45019.1 hypothetical protein DMB68_09905 [Flavobacterium hydrophilum]
MKTLFQILLLLPILNIAQVSPNVSKRYPAHIIYKIDEVTSKVNLSEDQQIRIAKKFIKTDSIVNAGLAAGTSADQLKNDYTIDKTFLKNILSIEEMEQYAYEMDKDNRFLIALKFTLELKLESTQINKIRQLNDSLENSPKKSTKVILQFQNRKLSTILNQNQYSQIINFSYKDESIAETKSDWARIEKLKINIPGKEQEEYQQIKDYHFNKNGYLDKKAERFEKKKQDFLSLKATLMEPPILIRAKILSDQKHANNKYASVVKFEKELDLTKNQIDTLLAKYVAFEKIIIENKENDLKGSLTPPKPLPSEFDNITKIITPEQFTKWLTLKNKNEAIKKANQSWSALESEGLTKNADKQKLMPELATYHLKLLIALEKNKNWKTSETRFLVRDVEQKKPEILVQLDAIKRSKAKSENAKNALAW